MDKLEKAQRYVPKEHILREEAYKELENAIAKLEVHLQTIKDEESRSGDTRQAKVTTDLALDVLRENVRKIINKLVNK